ncbi:MAG TPA: hypothetical protein VFQ45_16925 [Longimicrobium sp.]|nr:hypothetical protein [Longimicrobium sp.]
MKKLRLEQDDLRVESFTTVDPSAGLRGTVLPREATWGTCDGMETCYPYNTCAGLGCGSDHGSCGCGWSERTCSWQDTCDYTCNCGLTYMCGTGGATDCPGMTDCAPWTEDITCYGSCTDQGCTACGAVC